MSTGPGVMTADELIRLPRGQWRYELVRGELRQMTPAGHLHGKVAADVLSRMAVFAREHHLGVTYAAETGFYLRRNPDTVRAADASFVRAARLASMALFRDGYFPGAPDLAIEVISPSDTYSEVDEKVAEWLDAGCRAVVVLDPRRKAGTVHRPATEVLRLAETDHLALPDLLPGWSLSLSDIW